MTKLNTAQRDLLSLAAQAQDGTVAAEGVAKPTATVLIRRGLFNSVPQPEGGSRLLITDAGRAEIGAPKQAEVSPPPSPAAVPTAKEPKGKIAAVIVLLRRPQGASLDHLMAATGWQAHSVRGAISGAIKKERGLPVTSQKTDGSRVYRIVEGGGE